MDRWWQECWRFETARFAVVLEVAPCEYDPADSFEFPEDIESIREGKVEWFDSRVRVLCWGNEIGADYLGGCAYNSVQEFYTGHRDPDAMKRNSSIMRKAQGQNVVICHYFPDMVRQAVTTARELICALPKVRCA